MNYGARVFLLLLLGICPAGSALAQRVVPDPATAIAAQDCQRQLYAALQGITPFLEVSADRIRDTTQVYVPYRLRLESELRRLDQLDAAMAKVNAALTACRP